MVVNYSRFASFLLLTLIACGGNYHKSCWDDVCKIVDNGVVTYEGNPEKIAEIKAREQVYIDRLQAREAKIAARQAAISELPKRGPNEIIRVGIIMPESYHFSLDKHKGTFYRWILQPLQKDPKIRVIPHKKMSSYLSAVYQTVPVNKGWNESGPREKQAFVPDESTFHKLRDLGLDVDVLIYTSLSVKTQSGLVGGRGQGVGVISASKVEISGLASSIFQFNAHRHSVLGKSVGKLDIQGVDKEGEVKSASLGNNQRDIKKDEAAARSYGRYLASVIKSQIAPHLPSLKALKDFEAKQPRL
ncbi:hypothetical protein [Aliikangiella sp. G2MR2-5]|uniref:hypothetical protein n=1 Tax=Aliikangiella sp. G2MR2-5 TaxID=2788943 RepID=UPI0018AA8A54|nr:hypothetical protein [Aliikangiella sp. G2MR2-5]